MSHTHTLAQKYLIELLMWNASHVQKTLQLNLTGTVERLEVRNSAKEIFLRPCSKDLPVLMQLSQIAKAVQVLT